MPKPKLTLWVGALGPRVAVAGALTLVVSAVVVMLGSGGSWLSVMAGCALFALGVRLAESGIGQCLYGPRHLRLAEPQEALQD